MCLNFRDCQAFRQNIEHCSDYFREVILIVRELLIPQNCIMVGASILEYIFSLKEGDKCD